MADGATINQFRTAAHSARGIKTGFLWVLRTSITKADHPGKAAGLSRMGLTN